MDDDEAYQIVFGKVIAGLRERASLSQQELAAAAHITQGTLSRIEAGKLAADVVVARRLAAALGVSSYQALVGMVDQAHEEAQRMAKKVAGKKSDAWFDTVLDIAGAAGLGALILLSVAVVFQAQAAEAAKAAKKSGGSRG
ncbi:MAG: helix-turn-helix domain-containing protein [Deltaproteobacteria bacterium]|nr:helix-turn-helix domain-containing protein [Kofleriaceae bacterium]